jgi:hypothetical protein
VGDPEILRVGRLSERDCRSCWDVRRSGCPGERCGSDLHAAELACIRSGSRGTSGLAPALWDDIGWGISQSFPTHIRFGWDDQFGSWGRARQSEMLRHLKLAKETLGQADRWERVDAVRVARVHMGSPIDLVLSLPWEWFAAGGGGVVFIKAVEYWLNSPQRIRAENARLRAVRRHRF